MARRSRTRRNNAASRAHVVMPESAPRIKIANVESFGAKIHFCAPSHAAREKLCAELLQTTGATLVHPYDDRCGHRGAGTAALELVDAYPDLDAVIAPIGGGGLLVGNGHRREGMPSSHPGVRRRAGRRRRRGAQLRQRRASADAQSRHHRRRLACWTVGTDVARVAYPCHRDRHLQRGGDRGRDAPVWERAKLVIEPSSAVPLAASSKERWRSRASASA